MLLGLEFPKDFVANVIKPIFRHLFRLLAHMYNSHYDQITALSCQAHLNTIFVHFWCFGMTFDLFDKKETPALQEIIDADPALQALIS